MTRLLPGDPASLSASAAVLRRGATWLDHDGEALQAAYTELAEGWAGAAAVRTRRAGHDLACATKAVSQEMVLAASLLHDQASDLAELTARLRALTEKAERSGLVVRAGSVELAWGVTGEASTDDASRRQEAQATLQGELDALKVRHRRMRGHLERAVDLSRGRLAKLAAGLRAPS